MGKIADIEVNGRVMTLEVPDGTTPEQAEQYARDIMAQHSVMDTESTSPQAQGGSLSRFARGVGYGLRQNLTGLSQRFGLTSEQDVERDRMLHTPLTGTKAGAAGMVVGQALPAVGASLLTRNPSTFGGAIGKEAMIGGVQGALMPTGEGEAPITNIGAGIFGGGASGGIGHGLSRLLTPFPNVTGQSKRLMDKADKLGIPVSPAQVTGSRVLRSIEHMAGDSAGDTATRNTAFNRVAAKAIGLSDDTDTLSPEALRNAYLKNDALRTHLVANTTLDTANSPEFATKLRNLIGQYQLQEGPARSKEQLDWLKMMADWYQRGSIPGDVYQANRKVAGAAARVQGNNQHFMDEIVDLMDSARPPGLEKQWQEVNTVYRNIKQIDRPSVIDQAGNVKPSALWNIAKGQHGKGDMAQLAAIGKEFPQLPDPPARGFTETIANPIGRAAAGSMFGGGASYYYGQRDPGEVLEQSVLGGTIGLFAPTVLQGMITSGPGRKYLTKGLIGGRNLSPALVPLSPFGASAAIYGQQER